MKIQLLMINDLSSPKYYFVGFKYIWILPKYD